MWTRSTRSPFVTITMKPKDGAKPEAGARHRGGVARASADVSCSEDRPRAPLHVPEGHRDGRCSRCAGPRRRSIRSRGTWTRFESCVSSARRPPAVAPGLVHPVAAPAASEIARKGTGFHARAPFDRDSHAAESMPRRSWLTKHRRLRGDVRRARRRRSPAFVAVARRWSLRRAKNKFIEIGAHSQGGRATLRRRARRCAPRGGSRSVLRRLIPRDHLAPCDTRSKAEHDACRVCSCVRKGARARGPR